MTFITTALPVPSESAILFLQICSNSPQPSTTLDSLRKFSPGLHWQFSPLRFNGTCSLSFVGQRWDCRFPVLSRCFVLLNYSHRLWHDVIKMASFCSTRRRLAKPETYIFSGADTPIFLEKSRRGHEEVEAGRNRAWLCRCWMDDLFSGCLQFSSPRSAAYFFVWQTLSSRRRPKYFL